LSLHALIHISFFCLENSHQNIHCPILYVIHRSFNNACLKLLYTKNEDDDLVSKICRFAVGTTYPHRLWKQNVHHILLLYMKENIRMQQTYFSLF
jgi:hypothetical protein